MQSTADSKIQATGFPTSVRIFVNKSPYFGSKKFMASTPIFVDTRVTTIADIPKYCKVLFRKHFTVLGTVRLTGSPYDGQPGEPNREPFDPQSDALPTTPRPPLKHLWRLHRYLQIHVSLPSLTSPNTVKCFSENTVRYWEPSG